VVSIVAVACDNEVMKTEPICGGDEVAVMPTLRCHSSMVRKICIVREVYQDLVYLSDGRIYQRSGGLGANPQSEGAIVLVTKEHRAAMAAK
jgi:hypothetical protein